MVKKKGNEGFICENCGEKISPVTNGSYRNHCPICLYSKHVDIVPGDRLNECEGLMKPIGIRHKPGKGFQIIHRCLKCEEEKANIVAENTIQNDLLEKILELFNYNNAV